jgi:hypothetical protein
MRVSAWLMAAYSLRRLEELRPQLRKLGLQKAEVVLGCLVLLRAAHLELDLLDLLLYPHGRKLLINVQGASSTRTTSDASKP